MSAPSGAGLHAVRGYVTEDGVVDQALILRNSLYVTMSSMPGASLSY
ncbi:hypothetical protein IVB30_13925 [Bradyrhizobium sp. 200]|nr:hypothetical protein [Bradyrhizobium sp. 200]UPJ52350.1 hypothetical protein IVB30_13925 [Bradyrhizobium sp. 200]